MDNQFDHVRRGLSVVQEILDQNYQELIDGIANEGYNQDTEVISQILQSKAEQLQSLIADKNRVIKALTKALSKRPQSRSDWDEIIDYFKTANQNGQVARASDVESLVKKLMPPKPTQLTIEAMDDNLDKCNTFSPFVVDVMTRANQIKQQGSRSSSLPSSSNNHVSQKVVNADDRIDELTATLKRNVELSNRLQSVLQDLLGTIQNYAVPILASLENLAKDISNEGNLDAAEIVSDMIQATENDLKGGSKLKLLLAAKPHRGEEESEAFDHYWSVRDSVELAKGKLKKLMKSGKHSSDDNLIEDLRHLCKQMEISIREVEHTKKELEELQEMLSKYEERKRGKRDKRGSRNGEFGASTSGEREKRGSRNGDRRASTSGESKKSSGRESLRSIRKSSIEDQVLRENDETEEQVEEKVEPVTSELQKNKIFEGFEILQKLSEDKPTGRLEPIEEAPVFEAIPGTLTERIDRLLYAVRRKISFVKRSEP